MHINSFNFKSKCVHLFFFLFLLSFTHTIKSQQIPISDTWVYDSIRLQQLKGINLKESMTLMIRPIRPDSFLFNPSFQKNKPRHFIDLLPFSSTIRFNTKRPFGWNDGGFRSNRGFQQQFTTGVYGRLGIIDFQLQPELLFFGNTKFISTNTFGSDFNNSRFKLLFGQSSMQLRVGKLAFGFGSRNLWWGPSQFSPLILSNNSQGFLHWYISSDRPIKALLGKFEFQIIGGILKHDSILPMENNFLRPLMKSQQDRYLSAFVLTYSPKWIKNLMIGSALAEYSYISDLSLYKKNFFKKYLSVFSFSNSQENFDSYFGRSIPSDALASFFVRYLFPKHMAEFYFEYGLNDFKKNIRDLTVNPSHASAYTLGTKKLVNRGSRTVEINFEITQTAQNTSYLLRDVGNWYRHSQIREGYTHNNQIIGAGIGFGNNSQTLQVISRKSYNYLGIQLQRIQQDPKGIQGPFESLGMRPFSWTDWSVGVMAQKKWNRFFAKAELQGVQAVNYGWEKGNLFNVFFQCQLGYLW